MAQRELCSGILNPLNPEVSAPESPWRLNTQHTLPHQSASFPPTHTHQSPTPTQLPWSPRWQLLLSLQVSCQEESHRNSEGWSLTFFLLMSPSCGDPRIQAEHLEISAGCLALEEHTAPWPTLHPSPDDDGDGFYRRGPSAMAQMMAQLCPQAASSLSKAALLPFSVFTTPQAVTQP